MDLQISCTLIGGLDSSWNVSRNACSHPESTLLEENHFPPTWIRWKEDWEVFEGWKERWNPLKYRSFKSHPHRIPRPGTGPERRSYFCFGVVFVLSAVSYMVAKECGSLMAMAGKGLEGQTFDTAVLVGFGSSTDKQAKQGLCPFLLCIAVICKLRWFRFNWFDISSALWLLKFTPIQPFFAVQTPRTLTAA